MIASDRGVEEDKFAFEGSLRVVTALRVMDNFLGRRTLRSDCCMASLERIDTDKAGIACDRDLSRLEAPLIELNDRGCRFRDGLL